MKQYFVYNMTSKRNGTLYVGVTNDLSRRISEHTEQSTTSFTHKYHVSHLVYYEVFDNPSEAIRREKNIKAWKRAWKIRAIESVNPNWSDLALTLLD